MTSLLTVSVNRGDGSAHLSWTSNTIRILFSRVPLFIIIASIGEENWFLSGSLQQPHTIIYGVLWLLRTQDSVWIQSCQYSLQWGNWKDKKKIKPQRRPFFPLHFPIKSFGLNGPFAALLSAVDCPPPSRGARILASGSRRHWQRITRCSIVRLFCILQIRCEL